MSEYPFEMGHTPYPAATLLQVKVYGVIRHVGIATGYGTVIHASRRFGRVSETRFIEFSQNNPVEVMPYKLPLPAAEIVVRARSKKGKRYNVFFANCEHFITWVVEGKARSAQLGPLDGQRFGND